MLNTEVASLESNTMVKTQTLSGSVNRINRSWLGRHDFAKTLSGYTSANEITSLTKHVRVHGLARRATPANSPSMIFQTDIFTKDRPNNSKTRIVPQKRLN